MFWTNIVKIVTKISFVLSFIGLILIQGSLQFKNHVLFFIIGTIAIIVSHSFMFMVCELADAIEDIWSNVSELKSRFQASTSTNWHCPICGKTNPQSNSTCSKCGSKKK